jgi:uncharacterized protein YcbX
MTVNDSTNVAGTVVVAGVIVLAATGLAWWKKRKEVYHPVGKISRLFIYPIKSCRGIELHSTECSYLGMCKNLIRDRTFVVRDSEGKTVTGRVQPKMVLVTPSFHDAEMWLDAPNMPTYKLNVIHEEDSRPIVECSVWGAKIQGRVCDSEVGEWFDKYLGTSGLKLVQFTDDLKPRHYGVYNPLPRNTPHDVTVFTDLSTYNIMVQASVDDLNKRLDKPVPVTQFRPNMVVDMCDEPYAEDNWKDIRVGEHVQFRNFKPCDRCAMTTVNPETGVKDTVEPLKTLRSYRQTKDPFWRKIMRDNPMLGLYLSIDRCGIIRVGDPVSVTLGNV